MYMRADTGKLSCLNSWAENSTRQQDWRGSPVLLGSQGRLGFPSLSVFIGSFRGSHITQDAANSALHTRFGIVLARTQ